MASPNKKRPKPDESGEYSDLDGTDDVTDEEFEDDPLTDDEVVVEDDPPTFSGWLHGLGFAPNSLSDESLDAMLFEYLRVRYT